MKKPIHLLILTGVFLICCSFPLTVTAVSSTIQKEPEKLVRLLKQESKEIVTWAPRIRTMIHRKQLHGNHGITYYRFSGRKSVKKACRLLIKDIRDAKTRKQYPYNVCYLHYDGKKKRNGKTVYQYSLYQTTREVLANPNGIPVSY